jgi:hypothetical protein
MEYIKQGQDYDPNKKPEFVYLKKHYIFYYFSLRMIITSKTDPNDDPM